MKNNGKIISKLFRNSVISIIAAAIATMLGIVIDGIIIGRFLGSDSMAAYGLVTPIINLATAFSGILATGAQIRRGQQAEGKTRVLDVHGHHGDYLAVNGCGSPDFQV